MTAKSEPDWASASVATNSVTTMQIDEDQQERADQLRDVCGESSILHCLYLLKILVFASTQSGARSAGGGSLYTLPEGTARSDRDLPEGG